MQNHQETFRIHSNGTKVGSQVTQKAITTLGQSFFGVTPDSVTYLLTYPAEEESTPLTTVTSQWS